MTSICQQLVGIEPWSGFEWDYDFISENDQQRFDEFLKKSFCKNLKFDLLRVCFAIVCRQLKLSVLYKISGFFTQFGPCIFTTSHEQFVSL
jgi:hypothetical protein